LKYQAQGADIPQLGPTGPGNRLPPALEDKVGMTILLVIPPPEPDWRISRIRLSRRWPLLGSYERPPDL
jgi:hypothetical protein